ncbi:MAG TPA: glycosyltransferase, partial [Thermoplasmatales archaeon]|nr:glycosyltransferase [Thermoplasmatales archaeon]
SSDGTQKIIKEYEKNYKQIKIFVHEGSRGEGRNFGVSKAEGDIVAFTDGGCRADKNWLKELKKKIEEGFDVVAGRTINIGPFQYIERVKIEHKGYDITYPSCNLAYRRELFEKIGGFDPRFITAEDIDLNLRAVKAGAKIGYNEHAVIYRRTAENIISLMKQSFWYGYGRKQLALKHGKLWKDYSIEETLSTHISLCGLTRLIFGFLGYLACNIMERK